jgi:hypothetical protein
MNGDKMTNETMKQRHVKLRAQMIRKRFEGHGESVREIVASLTDAELVAMEERHHKQKCEVMAAKRG